MKFLGRRSLGFWLGLAIGVLVARAASAQVVRGRVLLAGEGPARGVVLQLLDSSGANAAGPTLSDADGRFTLAAGASGRYMLRAMRIGVRPRRLSLMLGVGDTTITLRMDAVPLSLPAVVARDERSCNTRPDSGLALASVWNDVESALLAAAATRGKSDYQFAIVDYTRDFDFTTRELEDVRFADIRSSGARAWSSIPPSQLRRNGFVVMGRDSATFIAPDIETLASHEFIESHCYELASHRFAPDSLIAIDFTPAGEPTHPEVRGTLWLDRATHELQSVEFHYVHVGLSSADSAAGGSVRFAPPRNGGWIVTDWSVRAPVLRVGRVEREVSGVPLPRGRKATDGTALQHSRIDFVPDRLRVSGGTLREVRDTAGAILWTRPSSSVELHITSGPERRRLAANEAVAYVVGSGLHAATDSNGVAVIPNLVEGSYLLDIGTRELDVLARLGETTRPHRRRRDACERAGRHSGRIAAHRGARRL